VLPADSNRFLFLGSLFPVCVSSERTATGIGKEISEKLAKQGINVVIAALEDPLLAKTTVELQKKYPKVQIKKVACNLAKADFMDGLVDATKDHDINVVFNNAGFITVSEPLHQPHLPCPHHGDQPLFAMLGNHFLSCRGNDMCCGRAATLVFLVGLHFVACFFLCIWMRSGHVSQPKPGVVWRVCCARVGN
jgi:hypothetical protein